MHGLLAPAAFTVVLAEPPVAGGDRVLDGGGGGLAGPDVAGEERVYDDDGLEEGRTREEALAAEWAATGGSAGLAAVSGFGAWSGLLLLAAGFSSAEDPEGVERVRDGDVVLPLVAVFFPTEEGSVGTAGAGFLLPAAKSGLGRLEEERAGKLSSVFSYGFGAVAVEEEAAAVGQAAAAGAVPATTTGAAPGFWTM